MDPNNADDSGKYRAMIQLLERNQAGDQPTEKIAKAFDVCGLVHVDDFSLEKLHRPLRDCFDENFTFASWENEQREFTEDENIGTEGEPISVMSFTEAFSMFKSINDRR